MRVEKQDITYTDMALKLQSSSNVKNNILTVLEATLAIIISTFVVALHKPNKLTRAQHADLVQLVLPPQPPEKHQLRAVELLLPVGVAVLEIPRA